MSQSIASHAGRAIPRRILLACIGLGALVRPHSRGAAAVAADAPRANAVKFESLEQVETIASQGPAVLYFHADWCPVCRSTMTTFRARWPEVRPDITVILVDYDVETGLKQKYGVSYQNTFVQIGPRGERIGLWNGGGIEQLNERTQARTP